MSDSMSPPPPDSAAIAAKCLTSLFEGCTTLKGGAWVMEVRLARHKCVPWELDGSSAAEVEGFLRHALSTNAIEKKLALEIGTTLRRGTESPEPDVYWDRFLTAVVVEVDPHRLFEEGQVLYDPSAVPGIRIDDTAFRRAWEVCRDQILCFRPRPSLVVSCGGRFYVAFRLVEPLVLVGSAALRRADVRWYLARRFHGGYPCEYLRAPVRYGGDGATTVPLRVLRNEPQRFTLDELDTIAHSATRIDLGCGDVDPHNHRFRPAHPAMRLSSLPEDWALEDLELSPGALEILIGVPAASGRVVLKADSELIRALAFAGYGALDAWRVLTDPRFVPGRTNRFAAQEELGVRAVFRVALERAYGPLPLRLPLGVKRISSFRSADPDGGWRYFVEGGSKARPFGLEVSHEVLCSPRKFATALGAFLGCALPPPPKNFWIAALRAAQGHPGIWRQGVESAAGVLSLESRILEYVSKAAEPFHRYGTKDKATTVAWPALIATIAYFPLRHLRGELAKGVRGAPPPCGEVTAIVRRLGGDSYGTLRIGAQTFRVWRLPYRGKTPNASRVVTPPHAPSPRPA